MSLPEKIKNQYQATWESRSSIRSRARKTIDFSKGGYFFPEEKQPILLNEDIKNLPSFEKEKILLLTFYKYLDDIINLEIKLVNEACNKIIYSNLVVNYDEYVKLNAFTVLIDEYYHVYIAKDIILQLDSHYPNLKKIDSVESDAYIAVETIKKQLDQKYHDIFIIIAVCIFETTLIRELSEFFNSSNINPSVIHYINDHMNDEAKHAGFFFNVLKHTWNTLPEDYKLNIGRHIGYFIKLYLNVNSARNFSVSLLDNVNVNKDKAIKIVNSIYDGFTITSDIPLVKNVLNVLKNAELLNDSNVLKGFQEIGWNLKG